MKTKSPVLRALALSLLCLGAGSATLRAQVILNPNPLTGTVRLNNSNAAILDLLDAPGNEGFTNLYVRADSLPPAPAFSANSENLSATGRLETSYTLTVDSANPGIAYSVSPIATLNFDHQTYYFDPRTSAPVVIGVPPPALDFEECVGVVTVRFVTAGGAPMPVTGGRILATHSVSAAYTGVRDAITSGATETRLYLRGGETHQLAITVHRGTDFYTDRIEHYALTNVAVTCDDFSSVDIVIPDAGTLGRIIGNVDMLGEFEAVVDGRDDLNYPDYTGVIANYGPFANQRWAALPGVNFSTPSSGAFELGNVVPSTLDPLSAGYAVSAQMVLRSNRAVQVVLTPALGWGSNPPLPVTPGATVDLGNLLRIQPGFLSGQIALKGPAESLGRPSLLRGLLHSSDDDLDSDGLPDYLGTYGIYWTSIGALGVDRRASGANFTAAHGYTYGDFDGTFNAANSVFEGSYELVVGGLNSEAGVWKQQDLSLTLSSGAVTNAEAFYSTGLSVSDQRTNDMEIAAGQTATANVNYCFGEVLVRFRAASGTFWNPRVQYSQGVFQGTNFLGQPADYSVHLTYATGLPDTQANATNEGVVVMYLPEGTYTLQPYITPGDSALGATGLQPISLKVGCGQRIAVEPCLQVNLNAPTCSATALVPITGSVASCTNNVTQISYTLDGGAPQVVCSDCGTNPNFGFAITLPDECGDHTLVVTATDETGGTSSVTTVLHHDQTLPEITCPTEVVVGCAGTNGAVATFTVTATDNCPAPVNVFCTPASGSLFPLGNTTVNCTAVDGCGNTATCSFVVRVSAGDELSIERAVIVRWSYGGTLQGAENADGPYTDIPGATSPYCSPASDPQKFFRVRQ